jgi:hypothetical protein
MKVAVIRDSNGTAIAALHTEPRTLDDGLEVADDLHGPELLRAAAEARSIS